MKGAWFLLTVLDFKGACFSNVLYNMFASLVLGSFAFYTSPLINIDLGYDRIYFHQSFYTSPLINIDLGHDRIYFHQSFYTSPLINIDLGHDRIYFHQIFCSLYIIQPLEVIW